MTTTPDVRRKERTPAEMLFELQMRGERPTGQRLQERSCA